MATETIASTTSLVSATSSGSSEISVSRVTEIDAAAKGRQEVTADRLAKSRAAFAEQVEVSREAFEKVVSEIEAFVQNAQRNLDFQVDDKTGRVIVKVIDATNDEVIRQIPSEEMLALSRRLKEFIEEHQSTGVFVELKA